MSIKNKPLLETTEADLLEQITNQVAEGKIIDYKLTLPGNTDDDKKEFLADISSFANTVGGHLVFGMDEIQGIASNLPGISSLDPDKEKLRIENIIRDGISPRISGISIHIVSLDNGNDAIVIYVPKSWSSPHMVVFKNASRFYARNSAGKYQLDVQEIRQSFLFSESTAERIKNYRLDRLGQIGAENTPAPIDNNPKLVLHSIPISAFQSGQFADLQLARQKYHNFFPDQHFSSRFNLDGILLSLDFPGGTVQLEEYVQLFRQTHAEYVNGYIINSDLLGRPKGNKITIKDIESETIKIANGILDYQKFIGAEPPIVLSLSLLRVKDFIFDTPFSLHVQAAYNNRGIDRDNLILPDIILETFPKSLDEMGKEMKPIFDALWNAAGWPCSMNYDENGVWYDRQ